METFVQALCLLCTSIGSDPRPQIPQSAGDIWFTQEALGRGAHLLRVSASGSILGPPDVEAQLDAFAQHLAGDSCQGSFELSAADRPSRPAVRPLYAKAYVFHCR
jgi:hypothetical protein